MKNNKHFLTFLLISTAAIGLIIHSCKKVTPPLLDYKRDIKFLIENIADYGRIYNKRFIVIPNNGLELITKDAQKTGALDAKYIMAISGVHVNGLNYGPEKLDESMSETDKNNIHDWLKLYLKSSLPVFVTDYAANNGLALEAYTNNSPKGYISYVSNNLQLNSIPNYPDTIANSNNDSVFISQLCKNYILIPNMTMYSGKSAFIQSMRQKNYDMIIMDFFFSPTVSWSKAEIDSLKLKPSGQRRIVLSYVSIGQAQNNRFYWEKRFESNPPLWLSEEDKTDKGFYNLKYWDTDWQNIIYGTDDSYIRKITKSGFDGVYLDRIEQAYEYWEKK